MDLQRMFAMQRTLDRRIESQHGLEQENLFDRKLLALLVEVGELANETKCFKYWSEKPASPKEKVLEEFVDGWHFILSLGIELRFDQDSYEIPMGDKIIDSTLAFLNVFESIHHFQKEKNKQRYVSLIQSYVVLGTTLGFTEKDIFSAYVQKNELNHQRQDDGY
ncbi:dUTP diphosphatase [Fervidibacillus albus]|uniref:dUTP diphosphatase n=1 Tax=Fervidibacillus albus TaxID=2980026 RepID=A0A9E8LV10_9BACI|nr:dUTP diphosphatase [Fervidibacillus albus]WAA10193.1 dUTP diphosphatase [Fervidibacillus albus]